MRTKILLLILCMLTGIQMRAADGDSFTATTAEGVEMTFVITSEENHTVKVGDSTNPAVGVTTAGLLTIPASVEHEDNIYNVTAVANNAFKGCTGIVSVTIEDGVTILGQYAFSSCTKLQSVSLPKTIKTLGTGAFNGCKALKSIHLPEGISSIPNEAFLGCTALSEAYLPEGITIISSKGFQSCSSLQTIVLPQTLKTIASDAFNSTGLSSITLPASLSSIKSYAFSSCKKLNVVYCRMNNAFRFGSGAFSNLADKCSLHVPEGTKDEYIAAGWTNSIFKAGVVEGDDTPVIGDSFTAMTDEGIEVTYVVTDVDEWKVKVGNSTNTAIDASVTSERLTIPSNVTYGELIYNVTTIASKAFLNCTGINEVVLPSGITAIGSQAFDGCTGLKSVFARIETPFTFGANAFSNISNYCGLHVPEGTKDAYIEAGWTKDVFKGGVVEGDDALTGGFKFTQANADGVEITYVIVDIDEKTVQIGDDTEKAVSSETTGTVNIPESVEYDGVVYSVKTIGNNAFAGIEGLTNVTLSESLETIGANAFKDCTGITEVTIPASVTAIGSNAFSGCTNLSKVISRIATPFKLTANAFSGTNARCGLHVPEGTKSAYLEAGWTESVFKGGVVEGDNTLLKGDSFVVADVNGVNITYVVTDADNKIVKTGDSTNPAINIATSGKVSIPSEVMYEEIPYTVKYVSTNAFYGCSGINDVEIGETVTSIGEAAFYECTNLESIHIPESINTLGKNVFCGCSSLKSVHLPSALTTIPFGTFKKCSSLTEINFPDGITSIAQDAFNSSGITSAILPEGLTSIGGWCFYQCSNLTTIKLPESIQTIKDFAFGFTAITSITIPEGLSTIPNYMFADCYYLEEVHLPSTLKKIPREMFRHNLSLRSIDIPEGVTSIAYFAFYDCPRLKEVTLPSTLTSAETRAFYACSNLNKVYARMEDPFQMPSEMFGECTNTISLHIPDGTYDRYVAAGWLTDMFPGGIVYGDDTPTLNEKFTFTTQEGVEVTAVLTDIENNYIQVGIGTTGNPAIDQATEGIVTLPDTVEAFGSKYVITTIGGYAFRYANNVTEVRIPESVTHIGRYGFGNMEGLKKIDIPGSVKEMETASFYKCFALEELTLHEGTEIIGNYSFSVAAIKCLEIPKSVTYIGKNSFTSCEQLDKVISRIEEPIEFGTEAFYQISKTCGLHVPEGTKEAYIEKGWTEDVFPGGIVYGDSTLHKGQTFELTETDGTIMTYKVTDVNDMLVEITGVTVGEEANGCVTIQPQATDPVAKNTYTVSNIADKAFGSSVTKVLSRIEDPFVLNPEAFADVAENCALHVPAGTKATYIEKGWTEDVFPGGVVEGDDTLVKGDTFELTDEDGTVTTYRVTDVDEMKAEIVSVKAGEDANGIVTIAEAVTDPVNENDYTVSGIADGAFAENLKAVKTETATPFEVTANAFPGIGDKCVLFVPKGTKESYTSNGWTDEVFKGGVYEENIRGDVNEDLTVDISDVVATINTMANPNESVWRYADVNGDTKVDISDVVAIINIIAGQ